MTTVAHLDNAAHNLRRFVFRMADLFQHSMGFTYEAVDNAPSTMDELRAARDKCVAARGHVPFPIWRGASESTIYQIPAANYAFRFWHDMIHLTTGLEMTAHDETRIGMMQAERVGQHFGTDSLEYKLMVADTVGQTAYCAVHGRFPDDQKAFVYALVMEQHG